MRNMKKLIAVIAVIAVMGSAVTAFAAIVRTPAEIAADLTGKTVEELNKEREEGKTYGAITNEAGKLDEFKKQMLEQKKAVLDQKVKDGILTQQQADEIYDAIKKNQETCDGTGNAQFGKKYGAGFGSGTGRGMGMGRGMGRGAGMGMGRGMGRGLGMGNGSCIGAGSLNQ